MALMTLMALVPAAQAWQLEHAEDDAPAPRVLSPPHWSWDTLGDMAFLHAGDPQPYSATQLDLVKKFPMVQFDKKQELQTMPHGSTEDRIVAAAQIVKAASPTATVLMYINGLINFPDSSLYNVTLADPSLLLKNTQGEKVDLVDGYGVYDVRNPKMRKAFVDVALHGMASGAINGVFIDRANFCEGCVTRGGWDNETCASMVPAQRQLMSELQDALGEGNITLAKEHAGTNFVDWQVVNAAMTSDAFCSSYCHECNDTVTPLQNGWSVDSAQNCANSLTTLAEMSARGQLTQSHAMGVFEGPHAAEGRTFTIAAFLIGAGELSYFSYANWAFGCWSMGGTAWWPEYDKPLGKPTSPPNTKVPGEKWKYTRSFSSGTTVTVDLLTRDVELKWGDERH